ncbi:hypothetical protein ACFEMC_20745 [Kineococcus sp. DHX-1]|uniref:hypothetical protein n=1 Tax=Kineococcus sp. DHX-1 TaxID=3349638 RepID=UPI0036D40BDB
MIPLATPPLSRPADTGPQVFAAAGIPHEELLAGRVRDALATPRSRAAEPLGWAG